MVINRWHKGDEEALKSIEKSIKRPIFACLPNDYRKASMAVNLGMPLMENHNNVLTNRYRQLAGAVGWNGTGHREESWPGRISVSDKEVRDECRPAHLPTRKTDYSAVKAAIHRKLIQKLNLDRLGEIKREDVRREVAQILEGLVVGESTPMNLQERERLSLEILDEVFGLGPLGAASRRPDGLGHSREHLQASLCRAQRYFGTNQRSSSATTPT